MTAVVFMCAFLCLFAVLSPAQKVVVKYRYFDEYLVELDKKQQAFILEETEVEIGSGEPEESPFHNPLPIRTGVPHSKEEKCCMLGQLAGEKGFHCVSRFYATRLLGRNYNRAHNKKMSYMLKGKRDPYADKLMRTFEQCVARRGIVFHKCCRHAALIST